jgi:lysophospholipase L1-like esterase
MFHQLAILAAAFLLAPGFASPADAQSGPPIKIALAGDSTMCHYPANRPDRGWGMFLEEAFKPGTVEVRNLAKQGRSTKTFIQEKLWAATLRWRPDFVFIQFGHNDSHAPDQPESTDAATDYRKYLERFIADCRRIHATPVFVTPAVRRTFHDDGTLDDNLKPYAEAMKEVAKRNRVALIDLHGSSWKLVEPLGADKAQDFANHRGDRTHFNEKGARAMLDLVLAELPAVVPELAPRLAPQTPTPGAKP